MSKEIDINNEEQILKECDFDYYYNSEECSRELCMFYNDISKQNTLFNKQQARIDLGRIGITLNRQAKRIAELEQENESYQKLINDICNKHRVASLKELDEMYQATTESLYASREYLEELKSEKWELEEQLANSIRPKFKIGQEVWYYYIARNKVYDGIVEDIQWRPINGMYYRIPNLQRDYFWIRDDELFANKEEAQAKLEELKGENK